MRRYAQGSDHQDTAVIGVARPTAQRSVEAQLLALQRAAGNRAVSAELSRDQASLMGVPGDAVVQRACCASCAGGGTCESENATAEQ
jgi:hypothetical protein